MLPSVGFRFFSLIGWCDGSCRVLQSLAPVLQERYGPPQFVMPVVEAKFGFLGLVFMVFA